MRSGDMQASKDALVAFVQHILTKNGGVIEITKSAGMFVARSEP